MSNGIELAGKFRNKRLYEGMCHVVHIPVHHDIANYSGANSARAQCIREIHKMDIGKSSRRFNSRIHGGHCKITWYATARGISTFF